MKILLRIQRAWALLRWYWGTPDFDWSTVAELMAHQVRRLRIVMETEQRHLGWERDVRRMKVVEHLLSRMIEEDYYTNVERRFPTSMRLWAKAVQDLEEQDMDMLLRYLRYLRHWWS